MITEADRGKSYEDVLNEDAQGGKGRTRLLIGLGLAGAAAVLVLLVRRRAVQAKRGGKGAGTL